MPSKHIFYNANQKEEYIEFEGTNEQALRQYFNRIAPKEKEYGDLADMNENELKDTFRSLNIRSEASISHVLSLMRGYVHWATLNGKSQYKNTIDRVTPVSIINQAVVASKMIKSPEHLKEILDDGVESGYEYQENRTIIERLVFWLLYSGMKIEDLRSLKKMDIDYENRVVKEKFVYDEVIPLWRKCVEITYIEKKGTRSSSGIINYDLLDNDNLFRPIAGKKSDVYKLCTRSFFIAIVAKIISTYKDNTISTIQLSPLTIRESGILYRLLMYEQNGGEITKELIAKYFGVEYADKTELPVKTRQYINNYNEWKTAFGYM